MFPFELGIREDINVSVRGKQLNCSLSSQKAMNEAP